MWLTKPFTSLELNNGLSARALLSLSRAASDMKILICLLFSIVAVDFAAAACDINLRVKNETKYAISFDDYRDGPFKSRSFQVKTRGVPWRSVDRGSLHGWNTNTWANAGTRIEIYRDVDNNWSDFEYGIYVLESGKTAVGRYKAVLGCGVKRRYRLRFTCHELGPPNPHPEAPDNAIINKDVAQKPRYFPGPKAWAEKRNITISIKSCE